MGRTRQRVAQDGVPHLIAQVDSVAYADPAMRVRSISVRKLFGRFDHTIPLNLDERITIIHGPNGYGKTALLRLVDAAFRFDAFTLRRIPFELLQIELGDELFLEVCSKGYNDGRGRPDPIYVIREGEHVLTKAAWVESDDNSRWDEELTKLYAAAEQELSRPPNARELLAILQRKHPPDRSGWLFQRLLLSLASVHHISVQRLLTRSHDTEHPQHSFAFSAFSNIEDASDRPRRFEQTVTVYSDEFKERVSAIQGDYASKSQSLDSSFPKRVMEAMDAAPVPEHELKRKLQDLEQQRRRLDSLGILPSADMQVSIPASVGDDATRKVLWRYACDVEEKLAVFEDLANRVSLLQEIVRQRFQFKSLKIDAERGFVFESDIGQELPPTALSSGEQHQLVMVYECLFKIERNALLLMDEPELSLHVSWQVEFLHDLQRIIDIAQFDVLIATHSPQIIHDRWDLTVELQPPSEPPAPATSEAPVLEQEAALE